MKELVLHLGLPKTATTTLQHHLFQRLHDEGQINFLGKVIEFDKITGKPAFKNNRGGIIREACEEKVADGSDLDIDSLLVSDRLNLFSDEGIMVYYPGQQNLSIERKIANLSRILADFEVRVLLSVRNPISLLFSLYIQLYQEYFEYDQNLNTFEAYARNLIKNNSHLMYELFFMTNVVDLVRKHFDTTVVFYEDLENRPDDYVESISQVLKIAKEVVAEKLHGQHENKKEKKQDGVYSKQKRSLYSVVAKINKFTAEKQYINSFLKYLYQKLFYKKLFDWNVVNNLIRDKKAYHKRPSAELLAELEKALLVPDSDYLNELGLNREKLVDYGYTR